MIDRKRLKVLMNDEDLREVLSAVPELLELLDESYRVFVKIGVMCDHESSNELCDCSSEMVFKARAMAAKLRGEHVQKVD